MDDHSLLAAWRREEQQPFEGWDFSYLEGRYVEEQPPWSYDALVRALLPGADSLLDMGTGGGERLSSFADALPPRTVATEGYPPNLPIARARLAPLGVEVVEYDVERHARLPFPDASFGVVINRHEAYDAREVARILAPGGAFLTQQVDGRDLADLAAVFGHEPQHPHVTLENCAREVEQAGLVIERAETWQGRAVFSDVGALVYFLHAVPWDVPDFSVDRYADRLLDLHRRGSLSFGIGRFVIQARRPAL